MDFGAETLFSFLTADTVFTSGYHVQTNIMSFYLSIFLVCFDDDSRVSKCLFVHVCSIPVTYLLAQSSFSFVLYSLPLCTGTVTFHASI